MRPRAVLHAAKVDLFLSRRLNMATLTRERNAWRAMIRRCTEPNQKNWRRYGGAGITVHPAWMASFETFLADLGPAPTQRHWLGRLNTAGNYEPGNCLWTTQPLQERRRQFCRKVEIYGQVMTAAEAGRLPGQPRSLYVSRGYSDRCSKNSANAAAWARVWM